MNIKKIATLIIAGAAALVIGTPVKAEAASSDKTKIKTLYAQLKKLDNKAAPYNKIKSLVTKLTKLDPKKATTYTKTGLKKLTPNPAQVKQAQKISSEVTKIVKKSDLSDSEIAKIIGKVDKEADKIPPYQAYVTVAYTHALA